MLKIKRNKDKTLVTKSGIDSVYARIKAALKIRHAVRDELVIVGVLNPNLSWTHYRLLTKIELAQGGHSTDRRRTC